MLHNHQHEIDIVSFGSLKLTGKVTRGPRAVLGELTFRCNLTDDAQRMVLSTVQDFTRVVLSSFRDGFLVVKADIEDVEEHKLPGYLDHAVDDLLLAIKRAATTSQDKSKSSKSSKTKSKKEPYVNRSRRLSV